MSHQAATPVNVLKRRLVGGKEWKEAINRMSEGQREIVSRLRSIRNRYPMDVDTQRDIATALDEITDIILTLNELLHCRDKEAPLEGSAQHHEA
jgi:hypothetical protein